MAINPELKYPGKIAPSSADYPYGAARNVTTPGDGTGTPWEAAIVNDILGLQQSLLQAASVVPSGTPEKVGASQYLQSLNRIGIMNWNAVTTYPAGGMSIGTDYQIYVSQQSNSAQNPVGDDGTYWVLFTDIITPDAAEGTKGIAEVATQDETDAGTNDGKIVTPLKLKTSLNRLTSITTAFATCADADPLEFVSDYQPADMNKAAVISGADPQSGVLIEAVGGGYFDLILPYMVLIGDSISEGHPALHGRLHPNGVPGYDPNYLSQPGQLSYELSRRFGLPVINQGIGGQTSVDIRNRWPRDVLAQVFDPGDGRGNVTLEFAGQKPHAVWLHVGVNDVFTGVTTATVKDNFNFFAQSCRDNGITLIVDNIGADSVYDAPKEAQALEINTWLAGEFKTNYPEVLLIDYLDWSSDGTGDYTNLKPGYFADTVHPNKAGYADFAEYAVERTTRPVFLNALVLNSTISGPSRFSRITGFTFNGRNYSISGEKAAIEVTQLTNLDDPAYRLEATEYTIITGDGTNQYAGFAEVYAEFKSRRVEQIFSPSSAGTGVVAAGVILNAALAPDTDYHNFGIASVDASDVNPGGNLTINLDSPATHLVVTMVGTSNDSYNFHPRWASGVIPAGQTSWQINLQRISDGVLATNTLYHQYQIIAYNFLGA